MIIDPMLDAASVAELTSLLERVDFTDGRATAGWAAKVVKRNEQAGSDPALEVWRNRIADALSEHAVFCAAARPKRIIGPLFSRYRERACYGAHVDEPILDGSRSDLAFTLFLTDPASYEGGELIIDTPTGEDAFKGRAGSVVVYPATSLHRVAPVTGGTRYAAAGWVRSTIRDGAQRELLFDLEVARQRLFAAHGKTNEFDLLSKCSANLMRMWCDD